MYEYKPETLLKEFLQTMNSSATLYLAKLAIYEIMAQKSLGGCFLPMVCSSS